MNKKKVPHFNWSIFKKRKIETKEMVKNDDIKEPKKEATQEEVDLFVEGFYWEGQFILFEKRKGEKKNA